MFLGDVIKEYRKNNNLTLNDFAKKTGLSVSYISQLENNRNPKTNDAIVPSLGTFSKSAMALEPFDIPEMIPIPVLGCIHAGDPVTAQECVEDTPVYIPKDWTQSGQIYRGLRIKGNSMLPKIQDGDRVIFRVTPDCSSGDIVIARIDGDDATVKRFLKDSGIVTLQPLNSDYSPIIFTGDEAEPTLEILGVVVQLVRDI